MAYESVAITAGSGTNIAVDTVAGQQLQVVKLDVGADGATAPLSTAAPLPARLVPATTGGLSTYHTVLAGGTNAANIKASPGMVYGIDVFNASGTAFFVKFHNVIVAPTPGSGVVRSFGVQAGTRGRAEFAHGLAFSTGIGITIVSGVQDSSTGTVSANDGVVDIDWI